MISEMMRAGLSDVKVGVELDLEEKCIYRMREETWYRMDILDTTIYIYRCVYPAF